MKYFGVYIKTIFQDGSSYLLEIAPNKCGDDKRKTMFHAEVYCRRDGKLNKQLNIHQEVVCL